MLIGIVGKTNTGKSTFFKAATLAEVEISNRPFVTLKPNHGIGFCKIECVEKDFKVKCKAKEGYCLNGFRFIPIELLDVAGLIKDAHKGAGLGLKFLDDLRQADALIQVIDISGSTNEKGEIVEVGSYNPIEDIKMLEDEVDMWLLGLLKKDWDKLTKQIKQEKKELVKEVAREYSGLKIREEHVKEVLKKLDLSEDVGSWNEEELKKFVSELRKLSKPMIIACNKIDVSGSRENFERLKKELKDYILIGCSSETELALREAAKNGLIEYTPGENDFRILKENKLNEKQKKGLEFIKKFLKEFKTTGVQEVLDKAVFELLNYIAVYPVANNKLEDKDGNKLPDVFLINKEDSALDFAFKIHTDIGNNFVKAIDLKTKKVIGKESKLKHRDVVEIIVK